jgi:hypothetical protein
MTRWPVQPVSGAIDHVTSSDLAVHNVNDLISNVHSMILCNPSLSEMNTIQHYKDMILSSQVY